jgi:hypothetical protein
MGIITKQLHKGKTNRQLLPNRSVTRLDVDQLLVILRRVIDQTPAKKGLLDAGQKLWLIGKAPGPWNVCYGPPKRNTPNTVIPEWTTAVTFQPDSAGKETLVTTKLAKWKTRDGKLMRGREFEQFIADFTSAVATSDPSYRSLEVS